MKVKIIFKIGLDRAYGCDRSHNSDQFGPDCGRTRGLSARDTENPFKNWCLGSSRRRISIGTFRARLGGSGQFRLPEIVSASDLPAAHHNAEKLTSHPAAKQVMVDTRQLHTDLVSRRLFGQPLNCSVEIVEKSAVTVSANHALDPEEGGHARAACHRCHAMEAGCRIKHHVPCRQFDAVQTVRIFDDELAAVVLIGRREEQRCRDVGPNALARRS